MRQIKKNTMATRTMGWQKYGSKAEKPATRLIDILAKMFSQQLRREVPDVPVNFWLNSTTRRPKALVVQERSVMDLTHIFVGVLCLGRGK